MDRITLTGTNVALDAKGLADDVAYSGGGYALTANDAGDSLAHKITILGNAATNHSGKTFTITGTDADGKPQTEDLAGPNGVATVTSTKYFKTVTSVTVDATTGADTFDIGWTAAAVSAWGYFETRVPVFNVGIGCVKGTGSPTYGAEVTYDGTNAFTHSAITGKSANFDSSQTAPCKAIRLTWSAAGQVTLTAIQATDRF